MAEKILEKLGYPLKRELKEAQAWSIVRRQLQVRRVRFVHIDEAQHLLNLSDHDAMVRLSDALKMVMEDDEWPVSLVLTGLPKLADFLTIYSQLRRRSHTVHLETLTLPRDAELLRWIATQIVENHAGMAFGFNPDEDFLGRLCHAAGRQFGAVTQIVRGAIERVLIDDIDGREVKQIHFARAYELFSGCRPDQNIMSARAWQEIEPLNALLREEEVARIRAIEEAAQRSTKHGGNRRTGHKKRKGA